jgi:hypothetical protein
MKILLFLPWAVLCLCPILVTSGCSSSDNCYGADLIQQGSEAAELRFCRRSWGGFLGPHGYIGYENTGYKAGLVGIGPTFTNPIFMDNPGYFHCIGTISLDKERNQVTIKLCRIFSEPGKPLQTNSHPANGTYKIITVREAYPDEREAFKSWITKTNS